MKNSTLFSALLAYVAIMMIFPAFTYAQSGGNDGGSKGEDAFISWYYDEVWVETDNGLEPKMVATPNPATGDQLRVFYAQLQGQTELALYDISGRLLSKDQIGTTYETSGIYNFQIASLNPGIYFVKMSSSTHESVQKVVVR